MEKAPTHANKKPNTPTIKISFHRFCAESRINNKNKENKKRIKNVQVHCKSMWNCVQNKKCLKKFENLKIFYTKKFTTTPLHI